MLRVVTNQQELAKSKSKSYIDGGIKAVKTSGIEDRKISFRGGLVILLIWYSSCYIASSSRTILLRRCHLFYLSDFPFKIQILYNNFSYDPIGSFLGFMTHKIEVT